MGSIWEQTAARPAFERLKGEEKTDVLIIGGGITGILCAAMLERAGIRYVLAEAEAICGGVTKNTTAKLTFLHGLLYDKLIRRYGRESAALYLDAQREALAAFRRLAQRVDCDLTEADAYVYSRSDRAKIEREVAALDRLGVPATFCTETELPFSVAGAVRVGEQAQFHPLKFLFSLAKDLHIYENTKILELTPDGATTQHGRIRAEKIIIATHFPMLNKHGSYFLKMYQHRSYVLALQNAAPMRGMYVDEAKDGLSFRNYGDLLLLGGGGHRTGKKGGNWRELSAFAREYYPAAREVCRFATQDCMTLDGMPYIGRYSARTQDLYVATGFNKWGMTSAMTAARLLCDAVQGKENRYAALFSPSRSILHPQLALNAGEALLSLLTPTLPRCPHMGCALHYNAEEHTWDCACHGSRFSKQGDLLDGPATGDHKPRFLRR